MRVRNLKLNLTVLLALFALSTSTPAQDKTPPAAEEPPALPKGIEVLARGPVHEAFASLGGEPTPTRAVPKRPPKPLNELPPTDKPEGHVVWIGGYWAWDDDGKEYLWVSGLWRTPPPHKQWIGGYWREQGHQWQWVPGFWTDAVEEGKNSKEVTYLPMPPQMPNVAPSGQAPNADSFYVPGNWTWNAVANSYAWRAGYWARVQPGYVWMADHYLWTPNGYLFVPGYWDLAVGQRGVLYAPLLVDPNLMTSGFAYTPYYAVSDTLLVGALFVQPAFGHYYFGDYYGPMYARMGYESVFLYGRRRYDSIVAYETWAHRSQPNWVSTQINVFNLRSRGVLPVPPRTLIQQNTIVQRNVTNVTNLTNNITNISNNSTKYNTSVLTPASKLMASKGVNAVPLDAAMREQTKQQAGSIQQAAAQRVAIERPSSASTPGQAHVASLNLPKTQAGQSGFAALRSAQSPYGAHPGYGPGSPYPTTPHTPPGQPMRGMPGLPMYRPMSRPVESPPRRPPPRR